MKYGLPDPIQYLENPWRPDRWTSHCKEVIFNHWDETLKNAAKAQQDSGQSLELFDVSNLSIKKPHKIWEAAGRISSEVTKAVVVNWMLMGVFLTRDKLFKFKKIDSPICIYCDPSKALNIEENLYHHLWVCSAFTDIREPFIEDLTTMNPSIPNFMSNHKIITISILDPESGFLPEEIRLNWSNLDKIYSLARNFVFNLFQKRKILTNQYDQT